MWSQSEINNILKMTGLTPEPAFLEEAKIFNEEFPFEDYTYDCDPLHFHKVRTAPCPLISAGFLPFWQENYYTETILIGCAAPLAGCIGARGQILNNHGGLISGNYFDFFSMVKQQLTKDQEKIPSEIIQIHCYSGNFSVEAMQYADKKITEYRQDDKSDSRFFHGAMSERLALELLSSNRLWEVRVAAQRLGGLKSVKALPALEKIAKRTAPSDYTDHISAAQNAIAAIRKQA